MQSAFSIKYQLSSGLISIRWILAESVKDGEHRMKEILGSNGAIVEVRKLSNVGVRGRWDYSGH